MASVSEMYCDWVLDHMLHFSGPGPTMMVSAARKGIKIYQGKVCKRSYKIQWTVGLKYVQVLFGTSVA